MTLPHQCRCAICGEIGVITPGLPNVFANPEVKQHRGIPLGSTCTDNDCGCHDPSQARYYNTPPETGERRATVQKGDPGPHPLETVGTIEPYAPLATCTHGYTRCMICKFPAP